MPATRLFNIYSSPLSLSRFSLPSRLAFLSESPLSFRSSSPGHYDPGLLELPHQCVITPLFLSEDRHDMADRARVGKHIVGHYPYQPHTTEDGVQRASTVPVLGSQPLRPKITPTSSAPVGQFPGPSPSTPHTPISPLTPTPEPPNQPTHPDVDLESGSEVPMQNKHWWQLGRNAAKDPRPHSEATSRAHKKSAFELLKTILFSSWANLLLVFIPVGIAMHFVNVNPTVVFIMNFLAIIPLAGVSPFPVPFPFTC